MDERRGLARKAVHAIINTRSPNRFAEGLESDHWVNSGRASEVPSYPPTDA